MTTGVQAVSNYLIPAVGIPRTYIESSVLSATPLFIDFRAIAGGMMDAQPFRPSGVFIDNTQGTGDLIIHLVEINYNIVCPAGNSLNAQFPAPKDVTFEITGLGLATVAFVDFPVMPYRSF